ncbi:sensor domain-containing diguanylate cyclase [Anaerophilus nitritogenes]|uniref:sensor domain-containing diguanylate cyclase n=1 Tax=Anaerophilus nitritogenes TaxID=2498136 RepID=UPI00101CB9D9|nr:sensor domain-containing diguanylate cyclase [Anaerophilus nitritogenes]
MINKTKKTSFSFFILLVSIPFLLHYFFYFLGKCLPLGYPIILSIIIGCICFYHYTIYEKIVKKHLQINKEMQKYNEMKDIMLQISNSIVSIENMDELLRLFVSSMVQVIDQADTASILIKNEEDLFEFKAVHGFNLEELSQIKLSSEELFLEHHKNLKSIIIKNPDHFNLQNMSSKNYKLLKDTDAFKIKSTMCTPIIIDNQVYGIVNIDNISHEGIFTEEDMVILEYLTGQLAVAIKNVLLFEKTLFLSRYDGLTQLYHRHYFDELFNNIYQQALRYNEQFCLCMIDLNNLKKINDVYGHLAGDLAIQHFADILKNNVRSSDILGRFGGDEFVLIFLNSTRQQTQKKIELIFQKISEHPLTYDHNEFYVDFSFGVAEFPKDSTDHKELFKIADLRMYKNKNNKKTRM